MPEKWIKTSRSTSLSGRSSRNTTPELALRCALHRLGLRFRVHRRILPSRLTVDILLPRQHLAVQVHGCFWHQHGCAVGGGRAPEGPNASAWSAKICRVKEAEERGAALLMRAGFRVMVVWECEIRANAFGVARRIASL
jgi:DNA mismatch endonuclease, patch repair protein